jgi:hypothetical protein
MCFNHSRTHSSPLETLRRSRGEGRLAGLRSNIAWRRPTNKSCSLAGGAVITGNVTLPGENCARFGRLRGADGEEDPSEDCPCSSSGVREPND